MQLKRLLLVIIFIGCLFLMFGQPFYEVDDFSRQVYTLMLVDQEKSEKWEEFVEVMPDFLQLHKLFLIVTALSLLFRLIKPELLLVKISNIVLGVLLIIFPLISLSFFPFLFYEHYGIWASFIIGVFLLIDGTGVLGTIEKNEV